MTIIRNCDEFLMGKMQYCLFMWIKYKDFLPECVFTTFLKVYHVFIIAKGIVTLLWFLSMCASVGVCIRFHLVNAIIILKTSVCILIKLSNYFNYGKRIYRIDFGGQSSKLKVIGKFLGA